MRRNFHFFSTYSLFLSIYLLYIIYIGVVLDKKVNLYGLDCVSMAAAAVVNCLFLPPVSCELHGGRGICQPVAGRHHLLCM